jgi:hypothetical protein
VSEIDALEIGYTAAILKDSNVKIEVLIPKLYRIVVNDTVYRL